MSTIYCSNCGKNIRANSNFCTYCGAPQHGREAAVFRAESPVVDVRKIGEVATQVELGIQEIPSRKLSPRVIWVFLLSNFNKTAILIPLFLIALYFEPVMVGLVFGGYLLVNLLVAVIVYENFHFCIDDKGIQKTFGVFHKKHVSIPFEQIQNVNINRSILERLLFIATIDIETAGSAAETPQQVAGGSKSKAEGHLPGVSLSDAKLIHDLLLQRAAENES